MVQCRAASSIAPSGHFTAVNMDDRNPERESGHGGGEGFVLVAEEQQHVGHLTRNACENPRTVSPVAWAIACGGQPPGGKQSIRSLIG